MPRNTSTIRIEIKTNHRFPSLNEWYSGKHWTARKKQKEAGRAVISRHLLQHIQKRVKTFTIKVKHNVKYDCDNCIPVVKITADTLVYLGIAIDDTNKFFKGFSIEYDAEVQKGYYYILIEATL